MQTLFGKNDATVHGAETFICKAYETLFCQKINLRRHKESSNGGKKFTCKACEY